MGIGHHDGRDDSHAFDSLREERMTIRQFLLRIQYSTDRPVDISPARWQGMLVWYATRDRLREPMVVE